VKGVKAKAEFESVAAAVQIVKEPPPRYGVADLSLFSEIEVALTNSQSPKLVSLFSGAGGMDIGFEKAGFETLWANEYDKAISPSFKNYFKSTQLDERSIVHVPSEDIPQADGVIGGPPCQSWSEAGARRGINDHRGQLFHEYIRVINHVKPKFFVAENVSGLVHHRNLEAFHEILDLFEDSGFEISWKLLRASDFGVPQDRDRVFIVGYRKDLGKRFVFPEPLPNRPTLKEVISDLNEIPLGSFPNHENTDIGFSPIYMSRNRVRSWDEQSFTILASDRHIPIHPSAPKMVDSPTEKGMKMFVPGSEGSYRRLSIRECARIQTFPDDYVFLYKNVRDGYKMIGNAVPVNLAFEIAKVIKQDLFSRE
jgi:DNA (cytosine-5)-methyltransferase 1